MVNRVIKYLVLIAIVSVYSLSGSGVKREKVNPDIYFQQTEKTKNFNFYGVDGVTSLTAYLDVATALVNYVNREHFPVVFSKPLDVYIFKTHLTYYF